MSGRVETWRKMTILVIFCQVFSFYSFFLPLFLLTVDSTVRSSLKFSHYVRDREFKILNASLFELTFSLIMRQASFQSLPQTFPLSSMQYLTSNFTCMYL